MNQNVKPALDSVAKAEESLWRAANDIEGIWDLEALVYLRSIGHDCHDQVADLIQTWKVAEQAPLDEYNECGRKTRSAKTNATYTADGLPRLHPGFWDAAPPQDAVEEAPLFAMMRHGLDATMLRTMDWCEIAGFDLWGCRLAKARKERLLKRGIEEPSYTAYWLFNIVRSDRAIELMGHVLAGYLEAISLVNQDAQQPWVFENVHEGHIPYASAITFAHYRLNSRNSDAELVDQAVAMLCRQQGPNGAWRTQTSDPDVSVESTAMALHALALAQPPGWRRIATHARDWLWSKQQDDGSWIEPGSSGAVHLTVLVLDAIALANGEKNVTFRWPSQETSREGEQASGTAGSSTMVGSGAKPQGLRSALHVSNWEDIEIAFLSEGRVQIRSGQETETCNFGDLGFADGRTKNPRRAWIVLQIMAQSGGIIRDTQKTHGTWSRVEKRIQEIRELLRQYFGISSETDPIPFVDGTGYRARFRIVTAPSYDM